MNTNEYMKHKLFQNSHLKHFINHMKIVGKKCYVAGGALTSIATGKHDQIEDYDIFFSDKFSCVEAIRYMKDENPHVAFVSDKAITYVMKDSSKIQFIYDKFYPTAQDIFKSFDFSVCMAAYDNILDTIITDENFWMHNSQKFLKFNTGTRFPIISSLRLDKYNKKGYKTSRNEVIKIGLAIAQLNLTTWEEAKKQLGNTYGFTLAYFKDCEKTPFSIEALIERIEQVGDGENLPMQDQYMYPYNALDFMILGNPVEYVTIKDSKVFVDPLARDCEDGLNTLIEEGLLEEVEVKLEDLIQGDYYLVESNSLSVGDVKEYSGWNKVSVYKLEDMKFKHGNKGKILYKVSFNTSDVADLVHDGGVTVSKLTIVDKVCRYEQLDDLKKGLQVDYKPNAKMSPSSLNKQGWAFTKDESFEQGKICQLKELRHEHIKKHVLITDKTPKYAHTTFKGVVLQGGEDITATELLLFVDDWSLCFGGEISIRENGEFTGRYNTD